MLNLQLYGIIAAAALGGMAITGLWGYNKGVASAEKECALERAEATERAIKKMGVLQETASNILKNIDESDKQTMEKLNKVLENSKSKPVTNVPCVPNKNFIDTWNNLKKEAK